MSQLDAAAVAWIKANLTAEDQKLCSEAFPANGIVTLADIMKLSKDDLTELKFAIGTACPRAYRRCVFNRLVGLSQVLAIAYWMQLRRLPPPLPPPPPPP